MRSSTLGALVLAAFIAGTASGTPTYEIVIGGFRDLIVTTFGNTVTRCYLITPENKEIDLPSDDNKFILRESTTLSECSVRISDLNVNDAGLWTLNAAFDSGNINSAANIFTVSKQDLEEASSKESEVDADVNTSESVADESEESSHELSKENLSNSSETSSDNNSQSEPDLGENESDSSVLESEDISEDSKQDLEEASSKESEVDVDVNTSESVADESEESSREASKENLSNSSETSSENNSQSEPDLSENESESSVVASEEKNEDSKQVSQEEDNISENVESDKSIESTETVEKSSENNSEIIEADSDVDESFENKPTSAESENDTDDSKQSYEDKSDTPSQELSKEEEESSVENSESNETENSKDTSEKSNEDGATEPTTDYPTTEVDNTLWLNDIAFLTRTGQFIDINMGRTSNDEECTLSTPNKEVVGGEHLVPGVTIHGKSDFVSCRFVIGPMEESLLGEWIVCGTYTEHEIEHKRCKRATISWNRPTNPGFMWLTTIRPNFNHAVHFGGTFTPAVQGLGDVLSCHVVTPNGEDLLVTDSFEYPSISLVQNSNAICSIGIVEVDSKHLGSWEIYGMFSSFISGLQEERLPMTFTLYDEDNPYNQAYNVTVMDAEQHIVNLGNTVRAAIVGTGTTDNCQIITPSGLTYGTENTPTGVSFVDESGRVTCSISIGPITEDLLGKWTLIGKFSDRNIFTERRLEFEIIQEDPSNPIEDTERNVEYLTDLVFDTQMEESKTVTIPLYSFTTVDSCHLRTPDGLQYILMEGFNIPGVEIMENSFITCGVTVTVVSEDLIGEWVLISRETRFGVTKVENRLRFHIRVEENVAAHPDQITITEGKTLHASLANPTSLYDTCQLIQPDNTDVSELIKSSSQTCEFSLDNVDIAHSGTWQIIYGTKIIYKAIIAVDVVEKTEPVDTDHVTWVEQNAITETRGPEDAIYCKVISSLGSVIYDNFGRCLVHVERVTMDHAGKWTMYVGLPGRIITEEHQFIVDVRQSASKPVVSTNVEKERPIVRLQCSVSSSETVNRCLFRDPSGKVLIASQGVGQSRYIIRETRNSTEDGNHYSCNLQISEPLTSDLGLWRCDLEAETETYYGHLAALCPWAMQDPEVAASIVAEPTLTPELESYSVGENEPVSMSCAVQAPIRYCYFRARNGTVFNVAPRMSSESVEYVGAGLDAGECGIRIQGLQTRDSGRWSCHVGLYDHHAEQAANIIVNVQESLVMTTFVERSSLVIEGVVNMAPELEYCRFVRIDGLGFTSDVAPEGYEDGSSLAAGVCRLRLVAPSILDLHPWTVVAKVKGSDLEISRVTNTNFASPSYYSWSPLYLWLPCAVILCSLLAAMLLLTPEKNRRWAYARASQIRNSFRKKPILPIRENTPTAA